MPSLKTFNEKVDVSFYKKKRINYFRWAEKLMPLPLEINFLVKVGPMSKNF